MTWNLQNFTAELRGSGIQNPNRFQVEFALPSKLQVGNTGSTGLLGVLTSISNFLTSSSDTTKLSLRCSSSVFPGIHLMTEDGIQRYGVGPRDNHAYSAMFDDVPCNFIVDGPGRITDIFYGWQQLITRPDSSQGMGVGPISSTASLNAISAAIQSISSTNPYEVAYGDDYKTTVTIKQLSADGLVMKTCILYKAFPVTVGAVQLDMSSRDSLNILPVVFSYRDHRVF